MQVRDIMTKNPIVTSPSATLGDATETLMQHSFRHLPVVEGGALVGMLSDRDLRGLVRPRLIDSAALDQLKARYDSPVSEVMATDVETAFPENEISETIDKMLENEVGALPVVDPATGELQGIVSYVDILRAVREDVSG